MAALDVAVTTPPPRWVDVIDPRHRSRLLYPNPVCFLVTTDPPNDRDGRNSGCNVMVVSWLTAVNNNGQVLLSINKRRHTARCLACHPTFVLCVPVAGMEPRVLSVGKCSGRRGDKLAWLQLPMVPLGGEAQAQEQSASLLAVQGTVAHLLCEQQQLLEADGEHHLVVATVSRAWVREDYWDGKCFAPVSPSAPPYLTFFGSQRFGYVRCEPGAGAVSN